MKFHRNPFGWYGTRVALVLLLVLIPCFSASAAGLFDTLKKIAGPTEYVVRGRLQTQDGQWLTCFHDIKTGYLGAADLARPGDARLDPTSGQMQISTAAIPAIVMTRAGVVTSNDCDSLASQQLLTLVTPQSPAAAGAGAGDGLIRDKYGCGVWTEEEFRRADKDEIMACQARVITEREAARLQAAAGATAPAATAGAQQAALSKLQADTAAQFAAIQAQAGVAAAAPSAPVSAEDLAWDGAKLCQLKPAYMMKLREEATQFVRLDAAADRIVMSEVAGGQRQEIALDGNTFAQRASFNATAIGQGGDTCGRAFWNAEAYKAASAAFSAPQP